MKELASRLTALDPDAGDAVRVIAYFDRLVASRTGLEALVRGAAVLVGCPARLVDDARGVRLRVDVAGRRTGVDGPPEEAWPCAPLEPDGPTVLWLERPGPAGVVETMVLERACAAIRTVLDRTRGRAPSDRASTDRAMTEVLLDTTAAPDARRHAARRLGLDNYGRARAVALAGGAPKVVSAGAVAPAGTLGTDSRPEPTSAPLAGAPDRGTTDVVEGGRPGTAPPRAGIGPAVPVEDLPASWSAARTALRFTAEGTETDPGPRVVHAEELGGLAVLATAVGPESTPVPDVAALDRAAAVAPWILATLNAVATSASLRTAASRMNVHHSTLQERIARAESLLGWSVHDPHGRLRLQLALALRRLHRNPAAG